MKTEDLNALMKKRKEIDPEGYQAIVDRRNEAIRQQAETLRQKSLLQQEAIRLDQSRSEARSEKLRQARKEYFAKLNADPSKKEAWKQKMSETKRRKAKESKDDIGERP